MAYSVLLVDDEEDVIQVIRKKLDWEEMGFKIAGYAGNGMEALEIAENRQIDIVMTDIKMPYLDGLTLSRKLRELYPNIKVIFFSGFDEFEYVKEAIKVEAKEYILKPINSVELKEIFERIKINLDREIDEKRNIEKLRAYYEESLPVLQENFFVSLIEGNLSTQEIAKYMESYQIHLQGNFYVASVLHVSTKQSGEEELNTVLLTMAVKRLAEEQMVPLWNSIIVTYLGRIVVITPLTDQEKIMQFTDEMDKFCRMAKHMCGAVVTAGIGYVCDQIEQLALSYQGAKNAVSYRVFYGTVRAINIAEVEPQKKGNLPWEEDYIEKILKDIKFGENDSLKESVAAFTGRLKQSQISLQEYGVVVMELVTELFRFCHNNHMNQEDIFYTGTDVYAEVMQMDSMDDLQKWLLEKCMQMKERLLDEKTYITKSFVEKAVEYVQDNFSDQDLSIETICGHLGVSAAYFSTVFKKETGKTFIHYLTDYRMEQAVKLLLNKDEKAYIIARQVGYSDPNYFSYVFKKKFGMAPSKYKGSMAEGTGN